MALAISSDEIAARFSTRLNELLRADTPDVIARIDDLCRSTGTDRARVYAWRRRSSLPSLPALRLVAEHYGVSADDLLGVRRGNG